ERVAEIEDAGKPRAGGEGLVPGPVGALRVAQVARAAQETLALRLARRHQPQEPPRSLGRGARRADEAAFAIAGAALTPAAVGVLHRRDPAPGLPDGARGGAIVRGAQPPERE